VSSEADKTLLHPVVLRVPVTKGIYQTYGIIILLGGGFHFILLTDGNF
jgi:hypothetical protein